MLKRNAVLIILLIVPYTSVTSAQGGNGTIEGAVRNENGNQLSGVRVVLVDMGLEQVTGSDGRFLFEDIPESSYMITYSLGDHSSIQSDVLVQHDATTRVDMVVDWKVSFADAITVYSASRRRERIVEAPAAITKVSQGDVELASVSGQVPRLLEHTVGVELAQTGLYDFNLNVRGFNHTANRRVQMLIDGRDPSMPTVSNQEWVVLSFLTDDLSSVELMRGPSAALYGPNTFNGVLNVATQSPRESQGGRIRLTAGELSTARLEARWAGNIGDGWFLKARGGYNDSDTFTRSRNRSVEYPGLELESAALPTSRVNFFSTALRIDRYFDDDRLLTIEGGTTEARETILFAVGRGHAPDFKRSWGRVNLNARHWNFLGFYNNRDGGKQLALGPDAAAFQQGENFKLELQGDLEFSNGRGRWVGGLSYGEEEIDTADPQGMQTVLARSVRAHEEAVFSQLDYSFSERLKAVIALRWDDSSLFESQLSPKVSLVYGPIPGHSLRMGYNKAFQVGNYLELFFRLATGLSLDLSAFEDGFSSMLGGVPLGLGSVPIIALGNPDLDVEEIESFEAGYRGVLGQRVLLSVDYYNNTMERFITDLLPGVNPNLVYRAPAGLPADVAATIANVLNSAVPGLTNDERGAPIFGLSHGNTGKVESQGVELDLSYSMNSRWLFNFTYSWFDFEVKEETVGAEVTPNAPAHQFSVNATYSGDRFSAAVRHRWLDHYQWATGVFVGDVPSYGVMSLSCGWDISDRWKIGAEISNLLDNKHYEAFGGDILERRALGYVALSW